MKKYVLILSIIQCITLQSQTELCGLEIDEMGVFNAKCCFYVLYDGKVINPSVESSQDTVFLKCSLQGCSPLNIVVPIDYTFQFTEPYNNGIKLIIEYYNNENNPDCDSGNQQVAISEKYYSAAAIDSMFFSTSVVSPSLLGFELSPNPTKNKFRVIFQKDVGLNEVVLFSSQGQKMLQRKIRPSSSTMELDVSGFATGIYFVQVLNDKGYSRVEKLVVGR